MSSKTNNKVDEYYEEFLAVLRRNTLTPQNIVNNYTVLSKTYKYSNDQAQVYAALKAYRTLYAEHRVSVLIEQGNANNFEELPPLPDQEETNQ